MLTQTMEILLFNSKLKNNSFEWNNKEKANDEYLFIFFHLLEPEKNKLDTYG